MQLNIDDRFNSELPADGNERNARRQVAKAAFSFVQPRRPSAPRLLHASDEVAKLIGLTPEETKSAEFLNVFSGAAVIDGTRPYAMCYGGHQFGSWAGQLGDGRAINLTEVQHDQQHWMLQLKGAGETPYSRQGDGLAVLRSSIREHLCSEAMYHLGVPTSRSLCVVRTGDEVLRDVMYDGHPAMEPGAVVCRVAPSFIRFGSFEIFAFRNDVDTLQQLTDYTIRHHYPEIDVATKAGYANFFHAVCRRTLDMVIHWQRVGFVHGVMNTDNMSIHGETIDYGPYGWLEGFDTKWTPNTTDAGRGRYCFGNQPGIAFWNLQQLASALYQLIGETEPLISALQEFQTEFGRRNIEMRAAKVGLDTVRPGDESLLDDLIEVLQLTETDMTIFYRRLADVVSSHTIDGSDEFLSPVRDAFYKPGELTGNVLDRWRSWFDRYLTRLAENDSTDHERRTKMNQVNPKYVLRNYMAQLAIDQATQGDYSLIDELYQLLKHPYDEQPDQEKWFAKRPDWARHKVGCSMLSCSS
ncbi:MAG: YdiU family protein [Planctomycetaceae bacterium]